jgi:hypothetical protein
MTPVSTLVQQRLSALGLSKPSPQLIAAIEARLAPRISDFIEQRVTKTLVARCFASTLVEVPPEGSPEGNAVPTLASSDFGSKPNHVAGTTADEAPTVEAP